MRRVLPGRWHRAAGLGPPPIARHRGHRRRRSGRVPAVEQTKRWLYGAPACVNKLLHVNLSTGRNHNLIIIVDMVERTCK
jgi:hypothetical protein